MGTFSKKLLVSNPKDPACQMELEMVIDSGATYTWIPKDLLQKLKIEPTFKRRLKLADGRVIERDGSVINIQLNGETLPSICIFGDEGSEPLLGAVTLEEFSLAVDPVNKTLVPVTSLLLSLLF